MGAAMGGRGNILAQRFLANDRFRALYEAKLQEIYQATFSDGALAAQATAYAGLIWAADPERDLVDLAAYGEAVAQTLAFIAQRDAYLATTPLLSGIAADAGSETATNGAARQAARP